MKKETKKSSFFSEFFNISDNQFKLFASCIPVKGINRGAIFDLQRGNIHFVPNTLLDLLEEYSGKKIFKDYYKQKEIIEKYFNYLYDNELIFLTDEPHNFPRISTEKSSIPNLLDFLSIEIDTLQSFKIDMLQNIDKLGVKELVIIQNEIDIDNIIKVISLCKKSRIIGITIVSLYSELIRDSQLVDIIEGNLRIIKWIFYDVKDVKNIHSKIEFRKDILEDILCKRINSINDFIINTSAYVEAVSNNLYFNRRAYIGNEGELKHSFDDIFSYGNIQVKELQEIILLEKFQELWKVTKNQVKECRNCEFRLVCPDNRIPKKINKTDYQHTKTCQYNPYSSTWNNEKV